MTALPVTHESYFEQQLRRAIGARLHVRTVTFIAGCFVVEFGAMSGIHEAREEVGISDGFESVAHRIVATASHYAN
jgi:hypothetical protein